MNTNFGFDLKWLSVTCFELRFDGMTVVTDPYITECQCTELTYEDVEACDAICLTHAHWDHVTDIPRLMERFQPRIYCAEMSALPLLEWLDCNPIRLYPMPAGTELDFGYVKIRAVYGHHGNLKNNWSDLKKRLEGNPLCQKDPGLAGMQVAGTLEYRNWLFELPGGKRIVLWNNQLGHEHLCACKALRPDVLILQRPGNEEGAEKCAAFAKEVGCKVLIPHHQDFRKIDDPAILNRMGELFVEQVPDGIFINPKHGEWIHL